ncbi:UDP-N-acetylglucosamine--N-acetylmuramyl-(pentapeptide) pyrophosphoryl-undecaprenol N-acetylglucosamine transferase [Candidatus Gracilibacteria bacterium]|nr:UDP-N-acetylglucosamine--N-acetylmuramyl-(pentapeptide) pyrophosphoryl-undecaprenol N-acetylglucosamine transferase [Candidatus Gracilibacteria bacterium]
MKNIALTGGGTGGHIFPLLAIYNYLKKDSNLNFIWFGDEDGLEAKIANENLIPFKYVPCGKINRFFTIKNFFEPLKNITGIFFGIYYLILYKIDFIIAKGGYVSLPLCIAGFILRKKIYIHESDTTSGIVNNFISKFATKIFYTFPNEKIDQKKHILIGQILNEELLKGIIKRDDLEEDVEEKLEVLVIAGSQGSTSIFESIKSILNNLNDINFTIILGDKNLHFRQEFEKFKNVTLYDFVSQKELGTIYQKTDIAISRAGATTLWELYFFGIHTIIVPLLNSAQNHQINNANYFKNEFQSDVLNDDENLSLEIFRKLTKYKDFKKNGLNLKNFSYSLEQIEKEIL